MKALFTGVRVLRAGLVWAAALLVLSGCAHQVAQPAPGSTAALLHDQLFGAPQQPVDRSQVFALNDPMRRYADIELLRNQRDPRRNLLDALYNAHQLQMSYDAGSTRNAAQAFDARAGNCLSLVILTAAFAKHLGMPVTYQSVGNDTLYTRAAGLTLASGHVNIVLGPPLSRAAFAGPIRDEVTVDFLPASELQGQRSHPISESTVLAMYFNNRAAEVLAEGRSNDAYALARAALLEDPSFGAAVNTLGVIYLREGHLAQAEAALRHVLRGEPDNTSALGNLRLVLQRDGRPGEAAVVAAQLRALQPYPPFHFLDLGREALAAGDAARASELFGRELRLQPFQDEVHFWAAQAYWRLGDNERAAAHLRLARQHSVTSQNRGLYSAKLNHLRALQSH